MEDQRHLAADIELVRETYQEREKELLVAAEIGKMLVEKNRTLEDDLAERENEFKKAIEEAYNYNRVRRSTNSNNTTPMQRNTIELNTIQHKHSIT